LDNSDIIPAQLAHQICVIYVRKYYCCSILGSI